MSYPERRALIEQIQEKRESIIITYFLSDRKVSPEGVPIPGIIANVAQDVKHVFYKILNLLSTYQVPANLTTVRLMTKRYVSSLVRHRDRAVFMAGLWAITGFNQLPLVIKKRSKGNSTYDLTRKVSILVTSITSFSEKPLTFIFYFGLVIFFLSSVSALYLIVRRVFFGTLLAGWPSLTSSIEKLRWLRLISGGRTVMFRRRHSATALATFSDWPAWIVRKAVMYSAG